MPLDKFYIAYLCVSLTDVLLLQEQKKELYTLTSLGTVHTVQISRLLTTTPTVPHYKDVTPTPSQDTARTVFLSSSEAWSKVVQSKSVAQVFFHAQLGRQQSVTVTMSCSPECCVVYALDLETNVYYACMDQLKLNNSSTSTLELRTLGVYIPEWMHLTSEQSSQQLNANEVYCNSVMMVRDHQ